MDNTPIKLNKLVEEFHYFEDNQVLTATQLNTVIDYLDRRDRMTRVKLFGIGVVCGLEISFDTSNSSISLSKGVAITSDGDLLHIDETTIYNHFGSFDDEKAKYPFFRQATSENVIPLFRLYSEKPQNSQGIQSLSAFNQDSNNLGDMVLVLYLNSYLEPPEECTEVDCENLGTKQKNELLPLLISKSDLSELDKKLGDTFFDLPETHIQRVDFHNRVITHEENLLGRYNDAITSSSDSLTNALKQACGSNNEGDYLRQLLQGVYSDNVAVGTRWETDLKTLFGTVNVQDRPDALYVYHFMRDLSQAYNEFREVLFDLIVDCCPSSGEHPKHIMLGGMENTLSFLPRAYRHHFCESPILNHKDKRVQKAKVLHKRLDMMIGSFHIPDNTNAEIKITPSKHGDYALGEKSLPYYYRIDSLGLNNYWHYEKTVRNQARSIPAYRAAEFNGTNQATDPLNYGLEQYNFFRIEGHLGKAKNTVESELERLKKENNINFNVVAVQIQDELTTIRPPRLRFPAIDILLHDYRHKLKADLSQVRNFNTNLKTITPQNEETQNDDYVAMITKLNNSKQEVETVDAEINTIQSHLSTDINTFEANYVPFKASFNRVINTSHAINENVYQFTQTKFETPLQKFVVDNQFNRFDGLIKYFKKKKEKVRQQYIFDKFYNQNPGMEHLSGVFDGGTFVLVYVSDPDENKQRVVADFCIAGCCVVEVDPEVNIEEAEDITQPSIPSLRPITFIDNISLFKYPTIKKAVDFNLASYVGKVNVLTDGLKDLIDKNDSLETIFKAEDLDRVQLPPYGPYVFNPGKNVGGGGFTFEDPTNDDLVNSLKNAGTRIRELGAIENKTPAQEAQLKTYTEIFDATSAGFIEGISNKEGDMSVLGDDAKVMEIIMTEKATLSEGVTLGRTMEIVENQAGTAVADKPLFNGMIGRLRT